MNNINESDHNLNQNQNLNEIDEEMLSNWDQVTDSFDELNIKKELLRGIYGYGFEKPSIIQQKAIIPIIQGRDVIGQAQSGTGKTAAFAIGTLQIIDPTIDEIQALVLLPTRELAQQIARVRVEEIKK